MGKWWVVHVKHIANNTRPAGSSMLLWDNLVIMLILRCRCFTAELISVQRCRAFMKGVSPERHVSGTQSLGEMVCEDEYYVSEALRMVG